VGGGGAVSGDEAGYGFGGLARWNLASALSKEGGLHRTEASAHRMSFRFSSAALTAQN
jgi:hypothetical protein